MDKFASIRHFNKGEALEAKEQIFADETFCKAVEKLKMGISVEQLKKECGDMDSLYDFQKAVLGRFLRFYSDKTATKVSYRGLENIDTTKPHLFIANHRDIIMDSAYLQFYFFDHDLNTSKIAIGDNLVSTPLLLNIAKLNKMFLVKRSDSVREKLINSKLLSEYIHTSMVDENESVWIAQRNGRTKDGIDVTQQGLIKMLTYYDDSGDLIKTLKEMRITPVTISYEYEPCDNLKARELALSESQKYIKQPGEDFNSICQGIFGFKGEVSLVIGEPITHQLDQIPAELSKNEKLTAVTKMIDQIIYKNYHLFHTNYIAYDSIEKREEFSHFYTGKQKEEFLHYIEKQSIVEDVDREKMRSYLLNIYANPVKTHYGKNLIQKEEKEW